MKVHRMALTAGVAGIGIGGLLGWYFTGHKYCVQLDNSDDSVRKNQEIIRIYDVWMMVNGLGKSIGQFLKEQGIKSVAIYGMETLGVRVYYELLKTNEIEVKYALDQNPQIQIPGIKIYKPDMRLNIAIDAVIVTDLRSYDDVSVNLKKNGYSRVIALDEMLYAML